MVALVGFYQNLFHHVSNAKFSISPLQDGQPVGNVFFLDKSCTKMHTIFSAVLRQQRKSDIMMSFDHSARSAIC
jgi:hypothetical protein